jgi:hypothetical protein
VAVNFIQNCDDCRVEPVSGRAMEAAQFFFEATKEEEVTWSKIWAIDQMEQTLGFKGMDTFLRFLGIMRRPLPRSIKNNSSVF